MVLNLDLPFNSWGPQINVTSLSFSLLVYKMKIMVPIQRGSMAEDLREGLKSQMNLGLNPGSAPY